MVNNRGNVLVLILGGIAIVFTVGIFAWHKFQTQTPVTPAHQNQTDETVYTEATRSANWKTYTNTKYNFSLNLPQTWEPVETDSGVYFKTHRNDPVPELYPSIEVKKDWSAQQELKALEPGKCPPQPTNCVQLQSGVGDIAKYSANGLEGTRFTDLTQEGVDVDYVVINHDNTAYIFTTIVSDKLFGQILSTFRFAPLTTSKFLDQNSEGAFCGGFAGKPCATGYKCQLDGKYPDAGGKCVKD